jgi:cell fate (sporulation/competence/biofilm development) regulator YlbF (YheA/YmcA/DUF963 family)
MQQPNGTEVQTAEERVLNVSRKFAHAIGKSAQFQNYEKANERLRSDKEAQRLLSEFREAQQLLQMTRSWGGASNTDMKHVEQLQEKLLLNPTLKEYFQSQEELISTLKELNVFISEKLGVDFATLTKPAGGCC